MQNTFETTYGTSTLTSLLPLLVWSWTNGSAIIGVEYTHFVHKAKFITELINWSQKKKAPSISTVILLWHGCRFAAKVSSFTYPWQRSIRKLSNILSCNPYVKIFRSLGSVPNLDEYKIELNTDIALDQRVYNAPTTSQVAAIWVEGNDPQSHFDRNIMVYGVSDRPQYIKAYHGCYDPLSYPLFSQMVKSDGT